MVGNLHHNSSTAAIVLAAGASNRYGGFPKACLAIGDETAVRRVVRICDESGADPVIVVTGPHDPEIRRALVGSTARIVRNERWVAGRTGSLQTGIQLLEGPTDVLVWPIDHPFVERATLERLTDARAQDPLAVWFLPMFAGQGGHPILLRREVLPALAMLGPDAPLRGLISGFGPQVRRVAVGDAGVVANVDDPESYRHFSAQWRHTWTGA
ncbi:MAG: nucleotidyltransferase family protein [Thermoplasmata archaeon]|nr:nucleotidyltransferase family protein [Thermoplasmata archaeon]